MATNLALQLQVIEPDTDLNSIMIGNSRYSDDIWDLRPFITAKSTKESQKYIRFEYISDADMKKTVKQYAYFKLGKTKPKTVRDYINGKFPMFIEYCSINGIHSFADVTLEDYLNFNCTDGDGCFFYNCPNYITEVQFYPILKDELDLLEKEMARLKELGQEPAYQVQAVKYKYLKPLVESLEVQLNGKESVG